MEPLENSKNFSERNSELRPAQGSALSRLGLWLPAVVLIAVLLTLPGLGEKQFYTRGEPREALVADQMVRSGNYILPRAYGGEIPSKPPLTHWLNSFFALPGGQVTELTARLPAAVSSILLVAYLLLLLSRRGSPRRAVLTAIITMTSFEWWRSATTARVDTLLSVLIAVALLELYRWRERELAGMPWGAIAALSAATLTKGPVGLILAGAIFGLYLLLTGVPFLRASQKTAYALAASAVIAGLWYLAAYIQEPKLFLDKFYHENIARFLGQMEDDAHYHSAGYMLGTLGYGMLPWIFPGLLAAFGAFKVALAESRRTGESLMSAIKRLDRLVLFSLLSAALIVLFFCIPSSKRSVYLLPAYPFLAILFAELFDRCPECRLRNAERWGALILSFATLALVLCATAILAVPAAAQLIGSLGGAASVPIVVDGAAASPLLGSLIILLFVGAAAAAVMIRAGHGRLIGTAFPVMWVATLAAANFLSTPFANQLSSKRFAEQIKPIVSAEPDTPIYSFGPQFFGASFYLNRRVEYFDPKNPQPGFVLTSPPESEAVEAALPEGFKAVRLAESTAPDTKPDQFPLLLRVSPLAEPISGPAADGPNGRSPRQLESVPAGAGVAGANP